MIVSSFRNSVDESLGAFTRQEDKSLDLQLLRIILSRSKKFLWFVGCMETLESMNDRTLFQFCRFFKGNTSTHKKFEDQTEWKGFKLSRVLFTQTAISRQQSGEEEHGANGQQDGSG